MRLLYCIFCLLIASPVLAQFTYQIDQSVPVEVFGDDLENPWAGGLNSIQYNKMDLNGDGTEDLVLFDRTSNKINTFVTENSTYKYSPLYASYFPEGISNWMLLRDFNCDGKKDIFASDPRGMVVYVNISEEGTKHEWRPFNLRSNGSRHLLTQGFNSFINLQVNPRDLPAIDDIDNDGDLDILVFRFSGASTIEFHKNLSIERDGNCDSLQYERVTQDWGTIKECGCNSFVFSGDDCPPSSGGREEHQSGKAILTFDADADGDMDVLISEEQCPDVSFMENVGTADDAVMQSSTTTFPNFANRVSLFTFPGLFYEDVTFDGTKDLLVSPNLSANVGFGSPVNFQESSWLYQNDGANNTPDFNFKTREFVQDGILDFGENSAPALADYDNDGDLDLFVGSYISPEVGGFRSSIRLFENVGTALQPSFILSTNDYFNLSFLNNINLKPRFVDVNMDGKIDLAFSGTNINDGITYIYYMVNTSSGPFNYESQVSLFHGPINFSENFEIYDINQDGLNDILIGKSNGRVEYYKNIGSASSPNFILEDETFYNFDFSPFRIYPTPRISDLDNDGNVELLLTDTRGNVTIYNDVLSSLDDPQEGHTEIIFDMNNSSLIKFNFGSKLLPVVGSLYNSDKPSIIFGNGEGGLMMINHSNSTIDPIGNLLDIYPNPLKRSERLNIHTSKFMFVSILTPLGQRLTELIPVSGTISLDISNLSEGLYIVQGRTNNETYVKRLVITR